jgi:hypothetical protein
MTEPLTKESDKVGDELKTQGDFMKSLGTVLITFLTIISAHSVLANPTKFVLQQDLSVDQPFSGGNYYKMIRFLDNGLVTDQVMEPQCNLYATSPMKETIPGGTVIFIKETNIDNPQDSSQAVFHKDRSVTTHGEVLGGREFRVSCSDSAVSKLFLKNFSVEAINQFVGQFVILE